jgi:natural product biosynthesis luciferase-like monooxygenase protein
MTPEFRQANTIVGILHERARSQAEERAYVFLANGEKEEQNVTYGELDRQARTISKRLLASHLPGDRVLLLYPPGLEFLAAFFGALYAGMVAVPAYPPRNKSHIPRLEAIMADASVSQALTTAKTLASVQTFLTTHPRFGSLHWITSDTLADDSGDVSQSTHDGISPDTLALLQYTSGSTGTPKGVMVSHGNIAYNSRYIQQCFSLTEESISASWLPNFHDMGLIDGVIQPLYTGFLGVLLPPVSFVQKPARWLQAISKYRATHGGGPNFGYELCLQKITDDQIAGLDLSCWESAYNGAEPVRPETLVRFAQRFSANGVKRRTLYPCYGMAETTLMVCGGHIDEEPVFLTVDSRELEQDRVVLVPETQQKDRVCQALVSSGRVRLETELRVVDPQTCADVENDHVGELWVSGPTVCQGYWERAEETSQTFEAHTNNGVGPFLRTGDLGFVHEGEVFITGRAKDLVIIRGRNIYPQDIEATVDTAHPMIRPGAGVAFSVDRDGSEELIVVQELQRRALKQPPIDEIARAIVKAVADAHEVEASVIVLIRTATVPKTSSGKLQRRKAREQFLGDTLTEVGRWAPQSVTSSSPASVAVGVAAISIATLIATLIANRLKRRPEQISRTEPFSQFGLDSLALVELSGEISVQLNRHLAPTLLYDFPTIQALSEHLIGATRDANKGPTANTEPLAIIGVSCRLPGGVTDADSAWVTLRDGVDTIKQWPADRAPIAASSAPRFAGFLENIGHFDPEFFGISPREAAAIDPQHRLLLELAWEALETGGIAPDRLTGTATGVFIGISTQDYLALQVQAGISAYTGSGNALSAAAGRISYALGLEGPSMAIDTACSSSLVALHMACQSVRRGESAMAIVGGVNLLISSTLGEAFTQAGMMASDGRCKAFDAQADGYVRSEGGAIVVLKPLSRAYADGNRVLGIVRGSAVNQDGRSNGLTAPNGPAQERVIRAALADANTEPSNISYVEAHGTGTPLGDPIEVRALGAVFGDRATPLAVGSAKTVFGHTEAAAGLVGLLKTMLALQHKEIPPTIHLKEPNQHIPWDQLPVIVPTQVTPWTSISAEPRRAGVSSFGFTGTNAHVVLEEASVGYPQHEADATQSPQSVQLLALSARHPESLRTLALAYADFLDMSPTVLLRDVCATAAVGRAHLERRVAVIGTTASAMASALRARGNGATVGSDIPLDGTPPVAWMFTGQGSQRRGMGERLYTTEPVFKQALDHCESIFQGLRQTSLRSVIFESEGDHADLENLDETGWTQPALFALEYSLARLWQHWGVMPAAVVGHSVGEFVAATVAGVFSVEDGLRMVEARGRLMQALPTGGSMLSVFGSEDVALRECANIDGVGLAAINASDETVLSGPGNALEKIATALRDKGVDSRSLTVSHAFHSPLMEPALEPFGDVLATVRFSKPHTSIVSNVTGQIAGDEIATPEYWLRHIVAPVRFRDGLQTLASMGISLYLELGPQPVLASLGMRNNAQPDAVWLGSMRRGADESKQMLEALRRLYEAGVTPNWTALHNNPGVSRIALPTYPFHKNRYWVDSPTITTDVGAKPETDLHPVLGRRLPGVAALPQTTIWQIDDPASRPLWSSSRLGPDLLLPTSAYVSLVDAAVKEMAHAMGDTRVSIDQMDFVDAEQTKVEKALQLQVTCRQYGAHQAHVSVFVRAEIGREWAEIATARATAIAAPKASPPNQIAGAVPQIDLGVMFFNGADTGEDSDRYRLVVETAQFADRHGFSSVWVPERHYTHFGGLYPNPAVLHAALARETRQIRLMAGSVVLPLHHPLRATEDWAVVDNLSKGRVGISLAAGWNPNDFAMHPERYDSRREHTFDQIPLLRQLWRGELVDVTSGNGQAIRVRTYPAPVQKELPLWVTAAGNPASFARAGEVGAHLLTHLLDQDALELVEKIVIYREARARHGHDPSSGRVTVMVHTFLGDDVEDVRELVREPYCRYIKENIGLLKGLAYSRGTELDLDKLSPEDVDEFVDFLYERFFATRALLGTPDSCMPLVRQLAEAGVSEIACLVDFGPPTSLVVRHLPHLARLRAQIGIQVAPLSSNLPSFAHDGLEAIKGRCVERFSAPAFYRRLKSKGVDLGPPLQRARAFWRCDGEALAEIEPCPVSEEHAIELSLQAFAAAIPSAAFSSANEAVYVPTALQGLQIFDPNAIAVWSHATVETLDRKSDNGSLRGGVVLLTEAGDVAARIDNFTVRSVALDADSTGEAFDAGLYAIAWEARPLAKKPDDTRQTRGVWLLLGDCSGITQELAAKLREHNHHTEVVEAPGTDATDFLDPTAVSDLLSALEASHGCIAGIVHAWALDAPPTDKLTDASLAEHVALGCGALLHLVQGMAKLSTAPRLWIVTRNAQFVDDTPAPTAVAQSLVWGFGRTIAVEHPELWGGLVDLSPEPTTGEVDRVLDELLASDGEDQIAFRSNERMVPRLVACDMPPLAPDIHLDSAAGYLITGGIGGLGHHVAQWLIDGGVTDLTLTGVRERDTTQLPHNFAPAGVRVEIVVADASSRTQMAAVMEGIAARGKALKGIFHLAGLPEETPLTDSHFEHGRRVLTPKVDGGWVVHELSRELSLDFFVAFSSISSVWGSRGQPFYGAANHFLDALTTYRRSVGLPMVTVNWGPWSEGGMVDADGLVLLERMGLRSITPADAIGRLARLLAVDSAPRVVADIDWQIFKELFESRAPRPLLDRMGQAAAGDTSVETDLAQTLRGLEPELRRGRVAQLVHQQVGDVLGWMEARPADRSRGFFDLGMDSLMALDLKNRLQSEFGLALSATTVFNYSTVDGLADFLTDQLAPTSASESPPTEAMMDLATIDLTAIESLPEIDDLSDADVLRLLDEQIAAIQPDNDEAETDE